VLESDYLPVVGTSGGAVLSPAPFASPLGNPVPGAVGFGPRPTRHPVALRERRGRPVPGQGLLPWPKGPTCDAAKHRLTPSPRRRPRAARPDDPVRRRWGVRRHAGARLMDRPLGPRRRRTPLPEALEAPSRAAARTHLDARLERLRAYAAVLERAVSAGPPDARRAWLDRQLTGVRRDLRSAEQVRLPTRPAPPPDPAPPPADAPGVAVDGR
jgi:hypothetical protein